MQFQRQCHQQLVFPPRRLCLVMLSTRKRDDTGVIVKHLVKVASRIKASAESFRRQSFRLDNINF